MLMCHMCHIYDIVYTHTLTQFQSICVSVYLSGTLEPHLSALLWAAMLVSLAIVIVLPQPHGIRALIASTILRLIFSVGLEPTLFLLGAFNVSVCVFVCSMN